MRAFLLAALLWVGCEGKKKAPTPEPPAINTAAPSTPNDPPPPGENDGDVDEEAVPDVARERGVPARKACKPDCAELHVKSESNVCVRRAPGVVMVGTEEHIACFPSVVTIDCCPDIKADDLSAITKALGWEKATPDQRAAIAWLVTRVVLTDGVLDKAPPNFDSSATFSAPTATQDKGGVVLDYWTFWVERLHPHHVHRKITFDANGKVTQETLADLAANEDPALARQQAVEAAKKAGILKTAPATGSGSALK